MCGRSRILITVPLSCYVCLIFQECLPKLSVKIKCDVVKMLGSVCVPPSLAVDSEVCISGTQSDLETQSHPLIHAK